MSKQVIFITGASSGIGKVTALQLIKDGHIVYGAARRVEQMQDLVDAGGHALKLDVMDNDNIKQVVAQILSEQGKIDVLINNAGYAVYGAIEDTSATDYRRQFDVNLFGVAEVTKAVLPGMRDNNKGRIINVSSVGGKIYSPLGAWYHATKHALEGWSDCLRLELEQFGIDVVIIEPGLIKTEFGDVMNAPLVERSGNGPYAKMTKSVVDAMEASYEKDEASPPSVIAEVISKAVSAAKPKTRYSAGKFATMLLFLRKWTSDRFFDKAVMSQVKKSGQ